MSAASYMDPVAHAAEAIARVAQRIPYTDSDVRYVLRQMRPTGTLPIADHRRAFRRILRACLLEGLVCADNSSGYWRITDLGRAGVTP